MVLPGHALLEAVQVPQRADHIVGDSHGPAAVILGRAPPPPLSPVPRCGAGHHQIPGVVVHKREVAPPQGAQLSPAAAGVDRQNVEGVVEDVLLGQCVEEVLGLLVCGDDVGQVVLVFLAGKVPHVKPQGLFHELAAAGAVVAFVEGIHFLQQGGANPQGEFAFQIFFCHRFLHPFVDPGGDTCKNGLPPGNSCFLTPSVTPRPPNRPRKMGKLTPGKIPERPALPGEVTRHGTPVGDPGLSPALFSHLSPLLVFEETVSLMRSQTLAYSLIYAGGCFPGRAVFFLFC